MRKHDASTFRPQVPVDEEIVSPEQFNAHVTPDLEAAIRGYACFIRLDMCSYGEALNRVLGYAWRRGAWGFSPVHLTDLTDWIGDELVRAIGPDY